MDYSTSLSQHLISWLYTPNWTSLVFLICRFSFCLFLWCLLAYLMNLKRLISFAALSSEWIKDYFLDQLIFGYWLYPSLFPQILFAFTIFLVILVRWISFTWPIVFRFWLLLTFLWRLQVLIVFLLELLVYLPLFYFCALSLPKVWHQAEILSWFLYFSLMMLFQRQIVFCFLRLLFHDILCSMSWFLVSIFYLSAHFWSGKYSKSFFQ